MATLEGRLVLTRREIADEYGVSVTTQEKLFRERTGNGHPESVGSIDRQLVWDAVEWHRWYRKHTDVAGLESRADLQDRTGVGLSTLGLLWRDRAENGHPEPEKSVGNTMYWNPKIWDTWYEGYKAGQVWRTEIDRRGNAEDLILLAEAARVLHMEPTSITKYPTRPPKHWPEPVKVETTATGRLKRYYRRGDIWTYGELRERGGGGRPAGTSHVARRFPYDGDPRLDQARAAVEAHPDTPAAQLGGQLAREFGGSAGTWSHLVSSARRNPES